MELTSIDRSYNFVVEFMFRLVNSIKNIKNIPRRTILTSIPIKRSGNSPTQLYNEEFLTQISDAGNKFLIRGKNLLVRGSIFMMRGNTFRIRGNEFPMRGNEFRVRGNKFLMRGNEFRVRGNRFPVSGTQFQMRGNEFLLSGKQFGERGNDHLFSDNDFCFNRYQHHIKVSPITNLKN